MADEDPSGPLNKLVSGLELWADVGVSLGKKLDDDREERRAAYLRLQRGTPVDYQAIGSGAVDDGGDPLVIDLGRPDSGTRWEVSSCIVGGIDVTVAAAGSAGLYVGGFPTLAGAGLTNLADFTTYLPNKAYYGTRQLVVNDQEHLFVIITGGTANQTYVAQASATVVTTDATAGRDVSVL